MQTRSNWGGVALIVAVALLSVAAPATAATVQGAPSSAVGQAAPSSATAGHASPWAGVDSIAGELDAALDGSTVTPTNGTGYVRGQLVNVANDGVPGATVEIVDIDTAEVVATLTTRSDGTFGPVAVPVGNYTAVVVNPDVEEFARRVNVSANETENVPVSIDICPVPYDITYSPRSAVSWVDDPITFTVTAFGRDGEPAEGVWVKARETTDTPITFYGGTTKLTDENGTVTFTVNSSVMTSGSLEFEAVNLSGPNPTTGGTTLETERAVTRLGLVDGSLEAPGNVTRGDPYSVSAEVTNEGNVAGTEAVQYRIDRDGDGELEEGEVVTSRNVTLDAGAAGTATVDVPGNATEGLSGQVTHGVVTINATSGGVRDAETATITISNATATETCGFAGAVAEADLNDDCNVSDAEVNEAISTWATGGYTDGEIGEVLAAWAGT